MFLYVSYSLLVSRKYVSWYSLTNSGDGSATLGQGIGRPITVRSGTLKGMGSPPLPQNPISDRRSRRDRAYRGVESQRERENENEKVRENKRRERKCERRRERERDANLKSNGCRGMKSLRVSKAIARDDLTACL
jgi:hypothetical protein